MENVPEWLGVIIVMAPIVLLIVLLIAVRRSFKSSENDLTFQTLLGEPGEDPKKKKSSSRFILFLTSLTTLILTACVTSYYFFMKIYCVDCSTGLELDQFSNVLLALGIGVVPYAVNQVKKVKL